MVHVLRLGHRPSRDKRLTTHVLLAARAFGASGATYTGERDKALEETIRKLVYNWGGYFSLEYVKGWRDIVSNWHGRIVHLTMYGLPLQEMIPTIRENHSELLVIVGGPKVQGEVYSLVDWNVAVTHQPHSEVSALAVFLHELFEGEELSIKFNGARLRVVPQEREKRIEELKV
ncbi:MAG: tRNA (cytidine(56)-2'-O)-methyltransferase [Candidatus Bathyarchaeota archaeon]